MNNDLTIGMMKRRFAKLNRDYGATYADIARATGVSVATVARWNNPRNNALPSILHCALAGRHYGVSLDYLAFADLEWGTFESEQAFRHFYQWFAMNMDDQQKEWFVQLMSSLVMRTPGQQN